MRGLAEVDLGTLNLLVVGKVGLRLVYCDDGVLLALSRKRIVRDMRQFCTAEERSHLGPLAKEPDVIDPSRLGTLRRREE